MPDKIYSFKCQPGIQRDGTDFSKQTYTDGQWCRWYRGLPKKMGGYSNITNAVNLNIPRGVFVLPNYPNFNVYVGDSDSLYYIPIDSNGNTVGNIVNRTPAMFQSDINNRWTFDVMFSTVDNGSVLIAHAAPNLAGIDSMTECPIWYGEVSSNTSLQPTGFSASGGIVVLHPFLFIFGNNGNVIWTQANNPTQEFPGGSSARITSSKIVAGFATRGGNSSPAGLLWSLDSLIRVTQVGTTDIEFSFDTITSDSSILSSKGIVEYDGIYYWAALDRFLFYNGIVQELPNSMSLEFFFANVNMSQRQKVWATKIPKWGEIWWHFPTGNNTECNHAIVYNIREKVWYDTAISRSSGYFEQVFSYPIWSDNTPNADGSYYLWQHENGVDENVNGNLSAISSYFESNDISWMASDFNVQPQELDRWTELYRIEPDFVQSGNLFCIINGKQYARGANVSSTITWADFLVNPVNGNPLPWQNIAPPIVLNWQSFGDYVFGPNTVKIDMREMRRILTLKFLSNTVGGNYELGQMLIVARLGDARQ